MSLLDMLNKTEDWLIRKTMKELPPPQPRYEPDAYDIAYTCLFGLVLMLTTVATCGHFLAR